MVITVALYVVLGIIAFFVLIFTVRVRFTIEVTDQMRLWASVLGIRINIRPKKPKKYKIRNYTLKKIAKRDAKKAAKDKKKAEAKALRKKQRASARKAIKDTITKRGDEKKTSSSPALPELIKLLSNTLGFFFPGIFAKFHFHVARIKIKIGGPDAAKIALTYYAVSNALGPVLSFIDKHSNLHGMHRADIEITPDFLSEEIKADVKVGFSTSLGGVLGILIKTGFKLLKGYMKIKPTAQSSSKPTEPQITEEKPPLGESQTETA